LYIFQKNLALYAFVFPIFLISALYTSFNSLPRTKFSSASALEHVTSSSPGIFLFLSVGKYAKPALIAGPHPLPFVDLSE
jgi:hypothetical protein